MTEVTEILQDAIGKDSKGNELVTENSFQMKEGGETIYYWQGDYQLVKNQRYLVGNRGTKLAELKDFFKCCKQESGPKSFLFYRFEKCDEYIFSLEIKDYNLDQLDIMNDSTIDVVIGTMDDIIRCDRNGKVDMVAIKIGPQNNRDYTALKHYMVSSDNRTNHQFIHNMFDYIPVESRNELPKNKTELSYNLLVSGAPGTGKSHYLEEEVLRAGGMEGDNASGGMIKEMIDADKTDVSYASKLATAKKQYFDRYVTRVTFYEDYSYENFVGCYKPIPNKSESEIEYAEKSGKIMEDKITYKFVSGPFIDIYVKAKNDPGHNYFLLIEEINRAKAASVFGDIFQLLDRNKEGISDYYIKPDSALDNYLSESLHDEYDGTMKLPHNLYIWATMNSADQGVMPLDSAFKRRWTQLYMDINPDESKARDARLYLHIDGGDKYVLWENLRKEINDVILANGFDEDRCVGSWYFKDTEIAQINDYYKKNVEERKNVPNPLVDKLIYYLRQDVFRRNPGKMFKNETNEKSGISMSDLRRRVRNDESIDGILNLKEIKWEKDIPFQGNGGDAPKEAEVSGPDGFANTVSTGESTGV